MESVIFSTHNINSRYVLKTLEQLVTEEEDYVLLYLHGGKGTGLGKGRWWRTRIHSATEEYLEFQSKLKGSLF